MFRGLISKTPHLETCKWCSVISGGQLKRAGTMQTPAPAEV
jgi:hypothetical protein